MLSPLINVMSAAAVKAGKGLMRDFGEIDQLQISRKGVANFVSSADIRTEKLLKRELAKARPDYGFLMEEEGESAGKGEYRWIVDPLDGTSNFLHAIPYFCVSIALEKTGRDGSRDIAAAVTFDPIHNELFSAEKNKGAFVNGRRMAVSSREKLDEAMLVTGRLSFKADEHAREQLSLITKHGVTLRYFGATALDLANLAAGRIDACWYYAIQPWDIAAGLLLVREAGGTVIDLSGDSANAYSPTLLASNRLLALPVRKLLSEVA